MPGQKCKACGGPSEWEPDIAATVCTRCGTLEDPDQIVLAADLEPHERGQGGGRERVLPGMPFALKSTRTAGWSLPGQGKEGRDARNKAAMHEFMRTLVARLGYPGHADRACQIFDVAVHRSNALASIQQEYECGDHDYGQDFDPGDGIGVDNATGSDIAIGTSSHGGGAPSTNNKTKGKAKGKPGFRWGRNAKLTAAAAIAIALREAHKADPLRDLAVLIEEPSTSVARAFTATSSLLDLGSNSEHGHSQGSSSRQGPEAGGVLSADPSLHIPALKAHLIAVLGAVDSRGNSTSMNTKSNVNINTNKHTNANLSVSTIDGSITDATNTNADANESTVLLPPALHTTLSALLSAPRLLAIERTTTLLCALFTRLGTFTALPTPPTACALFMLALEAEARVPMPASGIFAGVLGARWNLAGSTVQGRYRVALEVGERWVGELPWAGEYKRDVNVRSWGGQGDEETRATNGTRGGKGKTSKGSKEGKAGGVKTTRAKEGKRSVVAKNLKDAVEFQEDIWAKKVDLAMKIVVMLEEDEDSDLDGTNELGGENMTCTEDTESTRSSMTPSVGTIGSHDSSSNTSASSSTTIVITTRSQPISKLEPTPRPKRTLDTTVSMEEAEAAVRASYARKRKKTVSTDVDDASVFLLAPTGSASSESQQRRRKRPRGSVSVAVRDAASASSSNMVHPKHPTSSEVQDLRELRVTEDLSLLTHLLTADPASLSLFDRPSRLRVMANQRGGADAKHIADDELFEDGELEAVMRTSEEVEALRRVVGSEWSDADSEETRGLILEGAYGGDKESNDANRGASRGREKKKKAPKGSERVDMSRLARLLGEDGGAVGEAGDDDVYGDAWDGLVAFDYPELQVDFVDEQDKEDGVDLDCTDSSVNKLQTHKARGQHEACDVPGKPRRAIPMIQEEDVEAWRPASPGLGGSLDDGWCDF